MLSKYSDRVTGQQQPLLVLASASPARRTLLIAAGIDPEIIVSGVDESTVEATAPDTLCAMLARLKAHAVAERLRRSEGHPQQTFVLGCDSVLAFDGEILGKPDGPEDAIKRWQSMRGQSGVLHTGHCLVELESGQTSERVGSTTVHFAELTDQEIEAYVGTGEPLWVAGAFTIDGLGGPFVEGIEGDHTNVVGLSLPLLRHLLNDFGCSVTDLWRRRHSTSTSQHG